MCWRRCPCAGHSPALSAGAKNQNTEQLRRLESCPNFHSSRLKMQQLGKAARGLGKGSACSGCLRVLLWAAKGSLPSPLDALFQLLQGSPCP